MKDEKPFNKETFTNKNNNYYDNRNRTTEGHPNYSIIEISQNTWKSPGINTWAVSLVRHSGPFLKWTRTNRPGN